MKYLLLLLISTTIISCKSNILNITIDNTDNGKAYLYNTETQKADSIEFVNNKLSFNPDRITKPTLFYLIFDSINSYRNPIYLILSDQETTINLPKLIPVDKKSQNINDLYPNRPEFKDDPNNNEAFYYFQNLYMAFYNTITNPELVFEERKSIYNKFIGDSEEIIKENKNRLVGALIIEYLKNDNLIQLQKTQQLYSLLEEKAQQSSIGINICKEVGLKENTPAPDFNFTDYHGKNYKLSDLNGKKVLMHFWSSTCAPCIEEIPLLLNLAKSNPDLIIINISLDTDQKRWVKGMTKLGITEMINFCDFKSTNGRIAKDYNIRSIPANYLLNETGEIIAKKQKLSELNNELK